MKNALSLIGIITITAIIGFAFTACTEEKPENSKEPDTGTNPYLTGTVTITGNAQVGETLTANTSALGGTGTISYQWKRGSTPIGTNKNTYDVQTSDVGSTITITVTRAGYSGYVDSGATAVVINLPTEGLAFELIKGNSECSVSLGTARATGEIIIPATYNGLPVTTIADNAFSGCSNMVSIYIPSSITYIGNNAFSGCYSLTSVTLRENVTNIGDYAFHGCTSLTQVVFMCTIVESNFSSTSSFPGDLRDRYLSINVQGGGIGLYYRPNGTTNSWIGSPVSSGQTAATTYSVTISWSALTDAKYYIISRLEYFSSIDNFYQEVGRTMINSFSDASLSVGTAYSYRIVAVYDASIGLMSPCFYILAETVPDIPTGLTATAISPHSITINWNAVKLSSVYFYKIYRSGPHGGAFGHYWSDYSEIVEILVEDLITQGIISFTDTELYHNSSYSYKVAACNSRGFTGEQSSPVSATTLLLLPSVEEVEMVHIPGGTFTMGSNNPSIEGLESSPQRQVTLSGFYMGKYEVTEELYDALIRKSFANYPKHPIQAISWFDAIEFCIELSEYEKRTPVYTMTNIEKNFGGYRSSITNATVTVNWNADGYRLPTEAEWEYACRAGSTTAYYTGDVISDNTGWYEDNSGREVHEVGKKPPNAWGLYDMHGNVSEWCWDWFKNDYYSESDNTNNPTGPVSGDDGRRVSRGGHWYSHADDLRSAYRYSLEPGTSRASGLGFRVVRKP